MRTIALLLLLAPAGAMAQGPEAMAQQRFEAGLSAREEGRHEEALEAFRDSNELFASPNSQLMMARSLRDLGRNAEAVGQYRLAAGRARDRASQEPRFQATIEAATAEAEALEEVIAHLRVELDPPDDGSPVPHDATVEVAGRTYSTGAIGEPIAVDPGDITVRASAPGHLDAEATVTLSAEDERRVRLALERDPRSSAADALTAPVEESGPWEALGWTATGLTVVSAALIATFAALGQDRWDTANTLCPSRTNCSSDLEPILDDGRTFEALTNVSWVATLSFATASVVLLLAAFL